MRTQAVNRKKMIAMKDPILRLDFRDEWDSLLSWFVMKSRGPYAWPQSDLDNGQIVT
jgi:hypothetical protein